MTNHAHWLAVFGALGLTACGSVSQSNGPGDAAAPSGDASTQVPPDAQQCFGTGSVNVCLAALPTAPRVFSAPTTITTDDPTMCTATAATAAGYCVIAATDLTISATVQASGTRPLIFVATGSITVTAAGTIDVGSHRNPAQVGAGADPASCSKGLGPTGTQGAAGGSFLGLGGAGGVGNSTGGIPGAVVTQVTQARGGCAGQDAADNGNGHATGGHGGGAVFLIALGTINVAGTIDAAGEGGGFGAAPKAGSTTSAGGAGSGGGAGGMIGLDGALVTADGGILFANGGGGGGGDGGGGGGVANAPDPSGPTASVGGPADTDDGAGKGGAGSDPTTATSAGTAGRNITTTTDTHPPGAGAGGGGAGIILAPMGSKFGMVSPPATSLITATK